MDLNLLWFILITILFAGFFFLEGFDYGVGILLPFAARSDTDRRILLQTIAPVWDGNEVWMITAGGALFAAFPHVYATMFSGFYLALFLLLLALIVRGAGFEFRSKRESTCWRSCWDWLIFFGSAVPALLWGVVVTNLLQGMRINDQMIYTGTFFDLLTPYTLIGGLTFFLVFTFHGASFLTLRLDQPEKVAGLRRMAKKIGLTAALVFVLFMSMTATSTDLFGKPLATILFLAAAASFLAAIAAIAGKKDGTGFILSSLAIVSTTAAFFSALFPRLIVSSLNPDWSLTIYNSSSSAYTLQIMTIAAFCILPVVLVYQGWTYWIFRKRINEKHLEY